MRSVSSGQFDPVAYKAINDAAAQMMATAPGMSYFYRILDKRQSDDPCVTVRVSIENGTPVLEYGVMFVRGLERSLLGSILYMQCMKLALHHCDSRKREPLDTYKLASDLVVAEYGRIMVDMTVPGNEEIVNRLYPSVWNYWDTFRRAEFDISKDLYLEKVFEILCSIDDEDGNGDGAGRPGQQAQADSDDGESQADDSEGQPSGDDGQDDRQESRSAEMMERYFSGDFASDDLSGWSSDSIVDTDVKAAAAKADQAGALGRLHGMSGELIRHANKIHVNTESLFRHFVDSSENDEDEQTWSRRDRRLPRTPIVYVPGKMSGRTKHILLAVDLSGSMYFLGKIPDCIRLMNGIVNGLSIDVCYWDSECSDIYDSPRSMDEIELRGGGSTDPQRVLDKVKDMNLEYDGIVFLTDCEFTWEQPYRFRNIMIVFVDEHQKPPAWCRYTVSLAELLRAR